MNKLEHDLLYAIDAADEYIKGVVVIDKNNAAKNCSKVSVEFTIECLNEAVKEYRVGNMGVLTDASNNVKFRSIDDIVANKINELKKLINVH